MALTSLIVAAISIALLYQSALEQHRLRLINSVKSQARLIESIAGVHAAIDESKRLDNWRDLALQEVQFAHRHFEGFGETGEYALARLNGDKIEFVLTHRHNDIETERTIPYQGDWAEPMRMALQGRSGSTIGLDYRGQMTLAAFEPVGILDMGLTAKIDLAEIRAPFIQTGLATLGIGLIIIVIASRAFLRIAQPITRQIEQQAETFRTLAETANEGIILSNTEGIIQYINPSAEAMFGYPHGILPGQSVNRLMSRPMRKRHDQFIKNYLETNEKKVIGSGRQLVGQRKDGSQFPFFLSIGDINLEHTRLFAGVLTDLTEQQKLQREIMEVPVREQRRIGQELHDGIGQQLTGLGMLATSLLNKASKPEYQLATQLASGLQDTLSQVRALSRGLVPIEIDANGFSQALKNLTNDIRRQSRVLVTLNIEDDIEFTDDDVVMHLYRIAQEALNNAVKHANACEIRVDLKLEGEHCLLEITDNGKGFPDTRDHFKGLGLSIMKYRASLFEGDVEITPNNSAGTRVCCRFPVKHAMRF